MDFDAIKQIIQFLFQIYMYLIFAYILMSWVPQMQGSPLGQMLGRLVEPYLRPFRSLVPPIGGMIDISPIIALMTLYFAEQGLLAILAYLL
ncbi:MAG: YggT family protein [Bacillaceae bacterium]|nr:YggT family protein [Bacillaceae bacterium]